MGKYCRHVTEAKLHPITDLEGGAIANCQDELEEIEVYEKIDDGLNPVKEFLKTTNYKKKYESIENRCWTGIGD